jgi:hypothetical protein
MRGRTAGAYSQIIYRTTEELAEKLGSANLSVRLANFEVIVCLTFCHPDRSEAQWSDLRCAFLPGIFATRANLHLYFQRLRGWPIQAIFWLEWDTFPAPSCTPLEQSLNEPHSQLMRPE